MAVSNDFQKQAAGYGLTTAKIVYRMPDYRSVLQFMLWQDYDVYPEFPQLRGFLDFWQERLEDPLHSVVIAHSRLIKPAEIRTIDGVFHIS